MVIFGDSIETIKLCYQEGTRSARDLPGFDYLDLEALAK